MRKDEEFCKQKLDEYFRRLLSTVNLTWELGKEPPDYYLILNSLRYAVEVTALVAKMEVGDRGLQPRPQIINSLKQAISQVEKFARNQNILDGHYHVHFSRPINNLKRVEEEIKNNLLEYIVQARHLNSAEEQIAFSQKIGFSQQYCKVKKISINSSKITMSGPVDFRGGDKAREEMCQMLRESAEIKMTKLEQVKEPKVLIFYDAYGFASRQDFKDCILRCEIINFFHALFIMKGDNSCFCIYTKNHDWIA
jgi:hypothetical protein